MMDAMARNKQEDCQVNRKSEKLMLQSVAAVFTRKLRNLQE